MNESFFEAFVGLAVSDPLTEQQSNRLRDLLGETADSSDVRARLLTIDQARAYLGGVCPHSLTRRVRAGELRAVRVGNKTMFDRRDLVDYVYHNKTSKLEYRRKRMEH